MGPQLSQAQSVRFFFEFYRRRMCSSLDHTFGVIIVLDHFFSLLRKLLDMYAHCDGPAGVIAAQEQYLEECEQETRDRRGNISLLTLWIVNLVWTISFAARRCHFFKPILQIFSFLPFDIVPF
jgi:hypothetical protein